jgi:hypothetical protein
MASWPLLEKSEKAYLQCLHLGDSAYLSQDRLTGFSFTCYQKHNHWKLRKNDQNVIPLYPLKPTILHSSRQVECHIFNKFNSSFMKIDYLLKFVQTVPLYPQFLEVGNQ